MCNNTPVGLTFRQHFLQIHFTKPQAHMILHFTINIHETDHFRVYEIDF